MATNLLFRAEQRPAARHPGTGCEVCPAQHAALASLLDAERNDGPPSLVNTGMGTDATIAQLAGMIAEFVGYADRFVHDNMSKADGTPRKLLDIALPKTIEWQARIPLAPGISMAHEDCRDLMERQ